MTAGIPDEAKDEVRAPPRRAQALRRAGGGRARDAQPRRSRRRASSTARARRRWRAADPQRLTRAPWWRARIASFSGEPGSWSKSGRAPRVRRDVVAPDAVGTVNEQTRATGAGSRRIRPTPGIVRWARRNGPLRAWQWSVGSPRGRRAHRRLVYARCGTHAGIASGTSTPGRSGGLRYWRDAQS